MTVITSFVVARVLQPLEPISKYLSTSIIPSKSFGSRRNCKTSFFPANMIGNSASDMRKSTGTESKPSAETLKLIEGVLDYIRGNLNNIQNTWGTSSPQYNAAREILQTYFDENMKKMNLDIQDTSLEDLIANMSLEDKRA